MSTSQSSDPTTSSSPTSTTTTNQSYSYATSKIVRTAVAAGLIVLALTAIILFFKISSWIRYRQRLKRQHDLTTLLQAEQQANAYEIAAWSDEPGSAPVHLGGTGGKGWKWGVGGGGDREGKGSKKKGERGLKRGRTNAYAVHEWEGVAA